MCFLLIKRLIKEKSKTKIQIKAVTLLFVNSQRRCVNIVLSLPQTHHYANDNSNYSECSVVNIETA